MLPSEFRNSWEDMAQKYITDVFIDFFDDALLTFHLIQELFCICVNYIDDLLQRKIYFLLLNLSIPEELKAKVLNSLVSFFNEFNFYIFENQKENEDFTNKITELYKNKLSLIEIMKNRLKDLDSLLTSKYFHELLILIKKLYIYIKFHDPSINFNIESNYLDKI